MKKHIKKKHPDDYSAIFSSADLVLEKKAQLEKDLRKQRATGEVLNIKTYEEKGKSHPEKRNLMVIEDTIPPTLSSSAQKSESKLPAFASVVREDEKLHERKGSDTGFNLWQVSTKLSET